MKPVSHWFKRAQASAIADEISAMSEVTAQTPKIDLPAELGDRVRDPITGFSGIVVVYARFLNGCARCGVQPETMKDNLPQAEQHFDAAQLEVLEKAVFGPMMIDTDQIPNNPPPGGPARETPSQRVLSAPRSDPTIR